MTDEHRILNLERQLIDFDSDLQAAEVNQKIDLLNELAWTLFYSENQQVSELQARELSETAYTLAESSEDGGPPYEAGLAYSLRTQGNLNMRSGDYPTGLAQLLKALQIFESLHLVDGLADVFDGLASIYFFIGDQSQALDMAYKQLAAAQQIGDSWRLANANSNLANIYFAMDDHGRALGLLKLNLKLVKEIKYRRMECATLVKLQQVYLATGEDQLALENGLRGLQMSQELGHQIFEVRALRLLALYYLKINDETRTISLLEQALDLSQKFESKATEVRVLLTMGEAYRDLHHFERGEEALHRAVMLAESINANNYLSQGHLLLSELYEGQGDTVRALRQFKQYYAIKELLTNEKSDQRVKLLEVHHDVETIKKDAEIAHLRTVELQQNISEKEEAQRQMQRQLAYARALSACSQTLISPAKNEDDYHDLLARALQHLLEPSRAGSIYLLENIEDPKMGFASRVVCRTYAPDYFVEVDDQEGLTKYRETFLQLSNNDRSDSFQPQKDLIPWSLFPADIPQQLANGVSVSRTTKKLQEANPLWGEFLSNAVQILSVRFFPIVINDRWWGTLSFDDRLDERQWETDELMMLRAATEIIKSSLQQQQAQVELRSLNNQLEQKVEDRTAELRDTVIKLSKEVGERERAENLRLEMLSTLEQRLIARTDELATFFDLILMAGQGVDLSEIFEYVVPRVMEFSGSQSVVVDLVAEDGDTMNMIAQGNLPEEAPARIYISQFPPELRRWMQGPHEPLLAADLMQDIPSFTTSFNLHDFPYQSYLGAQIRIGERIEGILSCFRIEKGSYGVDVVALVAAVAQQLGLILEINHMRQLGRSMAVFEERERLARELHDSVTQQLYSLNLFAHAGQEAAANGDLAEVELRLGQVEENALKALREMRLLLYHLRPLALESRSLAAAFEERFSLVERRLGMEAVVQSDFMPVLADEVEEELFYIISEALNNVLKHAQATQVRLHFTSTDGHLLILIQDNGRGFDPHQPYSGLGLENICLRTDKIGGLVKLETAVGQGTTLRVMV